MTGTKYIGMDVHKESISIAVRNAAGKLVMECVIETKAITILEFIHGLRGELHVTFEEGTWATWLYDLLKPHVTKLVVCDPRRNSRQGNTNDRIDASELSDRLYMNKLSSVYHGEAGVRTLKELARSYLTISKDLARVMTRVKAIYRSWGIPCADKQVYAPQHRAEWLAKITELGVHRRRVLLPATGCSEVVAAGSTARSVSREQETQGNETALPDSVDRPDPGGSAHRADPDTASLPHQATALEILRFRNRNAQQCRLPFGERTAAKIQEASLGSRTQPRLQS